MDRSFYNACLNKEVFLDYQNPSLRARIWLKYFKPETNSVYLIRRFQFLIGGGGTVSRLMARLIAIKLIRRYGIFVADECEIGIGLSIRHPAGIFITNAKIGDDFTIYQNCTIGRKTKDTPTGKGYVCIGNNVTMYANSMIIGDNTVTDCVTLGAGSCLLHGADKPGIYVGNPARRIKDYE